MLLRTAMTAISRLMMIRMLQISQNCPILNKQLKYLNDIALLSLLYELPILQYIGIARYNFFHLMLRITDEIYCTTPIPRIKMVSIQSQTNDY